MNKVITIHKVISSCANCDSCSEPITDGDIVYVCGDFKADGHLIPDIRKIPKECPLEDES